MLANIKERGDVFVQRKSLDDKSTAFFDLVTFEVHSIYLAIIISYCPESEVVSFVMVIQATDIGALHDDIAFVINQLAVRSGRGQR